jgi:hypothetical protein
MALMQEKGPYTYGGRTFSTLGALKKYIQGVLDYDNRVVGREFFDDVLADVVVERHYRWHLRGVRPTSFKFMRNSGDDNRQWGDSLAGFFAEWGWCRFSYKKALKKQQPTLESEFPRLCRERWSARWRDSIMAGGQLCEHEGCNLLATDVDHVSPQHREIVAAAWAHVVPADREAWWRALVGRTPSEPHFVLPEGHPATAEYDKLTAEGTYQRLCKEHHRLATSERR